MLSPSHLLSQVIMGTHFSEGGAAQLNHDVNKALVPLLAQFGDDIAGMQLLERSEVTLWMAGLCAVCVCQAEIPSTHPL